MYTQQNQELHVLTYCAEFPSVSSQLGWVGKRLSPRIDDEWKFSKWTSGFNIYLNSLLFDFWYHHPIRINVYPSKRCLEKLRSFFPNFFFHVVFLSVDFYFLITSLFASDLGCPTPCPRHQQMKCFLDPCMFNHFSPTVRAESLATVNGVTPSASQLIKDWRQEVNSLRRAS